MPQTDSPSRCPACQSRLLQPHAVMDTFERYETAYWQCVSCGVTFDWVPHGKKHRNVIGAVRRVVLAPGELNILTKESHRRTVGTQPKEPRRE
jgi:uncharacterized protein with PIN domain